MADPSTIETSKSGQSSTQFKSSHPSIVMPKHNYRRYRVKNGRDKTGLDVIKEKPALNSKFAIMHLMHRDVQQALLKDQDGHITIQQPKKESQIKLNARQ